MPVSVDIRLVYRLCTRLTVTVSSITKSYSRHSCLELDIWDGGKDGKGALIPVVWHGHTMTSKISFMDILQTIKVFLNFHPDSFPIILSFENHCSIPYQQVMAETLERVLGDSLYVPTEVSVREASLSIPVTRSSCDQREAP
jgi:Phosphatidylinositol-specific phospholipase C, X domain